MPIVVGLRCEESEHLRAPELSARHGLFGRVATVSPSLARD
jgi:hypothetical protein